MCICFLPFDRCHILIPWYLQTVKMIFFKCFLICMFKEKQIEENWTNLAKNLKKIEFCRTCKTRFLQLSCPLFMYIESSNIYCTVYLQAPE